MLNHQVGTPPQNEENKIIKSNEEITNDDTSPESSNAPNTPINQVSKNNATHSSTKPPQVPEVTKNMPSKQQKSLENKGDPFIPTKSRKKAPQNKETIKPNAKNSQSSQEKPKKESKTKLDGKTSKSTVPGKDSEPPSEEGAIKKSTRKFVEKQREASTHSTPRTEEIPGRKDLTTRNKYDILNSFCPEYLSEDVTSQTRKRKNAETNGSNASLNTISDKKPKTYTIPVLGARASLNPLLEGEPTLKPTPQWR